MAKCDQHLADVLWGKPQRLRFFDNLRLVYGVWWVAAGDN